MSSNTLSASAISTPPSRRPATPPHFDAVIRTETVCNTSNAKRQRLKKQYVCKRCRSWFSSHRVNSIHHVLAYHTTSESSQPSQTSSSSSQPAITSVFRTVSDQTIIRNAFNEQGYRDALVGLLTRRRIAFSSIEWSEMRDLALACNPFIEDQLITSRRTAVRLIASNYQLYKGHVIKGSLSTAVSPIHISTDLWTSPFRSSLLAVCAQWVDHEYKLQKALLGLPECRYSHSGEQQAHLLLQTLEEYGIQSRVGWHTGDNATSNDTCLEHLETLLRTKHNVKFTAKERRIRCIGHIINLSLQAFLLASSKEALTAALDAVTDVMGEELLAEFSSVLTSRQRNPRAQAQAVPQTSQRQRLSRRRRSVDSHGSVDEDFCGIENISTLRKLHQLCVWLRNSSIHAAEWDRKVGLCLGIDNQTRWSSWYSVMDRAIKKMAAIKVFMHDNEKHLNEIRLTSDDWDILQKAHTFLQPFASATLYAEGDKSSISQSLLIMDSLLVHYEQQKIHYSKDENEDLRMVRSIEMGWFVLEKYYNMTDQVPVYASAILLNPASRAAYLKKNWPAEWYEPAINAAQNFWVNEFKDALPLASPTASQQMAPPLKQRGAVLDQILQQMSVAAADQSNSDDLKIFAESPVIQIDC
ncbi:hypothetical protein PtrV1_10509 [Pyrenophora tritici-repentis]|nr:hypothetical protein PtrV1_10509 [Pyrenophora tritici-repentis]